jgi:hypothetical protein
MNDNDLDKFYTALSTACQVVGRPPLTQAAAKLFFNRLSVYPFDWVCWGMAEATDHCKNGFDFNVALVKRLIDDRQKINKFRADAQTMLEDQNKKAAQRKAYIESDEYKANLKRGSKCLKELKEMIDDV